VNRISTIMKVFRGPHFLMKNFSFCGSTTVCLNCSSQTKTTDCLYLNFYLCVCVTSRHGQSDRLERSCLVTEAVQWETGKSGVSSLANTGHGNRAEMYVVQQYHLVSETNRNTK
jgi:hypothetical protein